MSVSAVKTRTMAAISKPTELKQPTQPAHNTMVRYLTKTTGSEEHGTKQKAAVTPIKKTPKRKGKQAKGKTAAAAKEISKQTSDQSEVEPDEENYSEREVFSDSDTGEPNVAVETRYSNLAELENEIDEEIDPRNINLNSDTQPLVLLALLRKIEMLEEKHDQMIEENNELKKSLEFNTNKISDLEIEVQRNKKTIEDTQNQLTNVIMTNTKLREQGTKLKEKSVKAEVYSRRSNLRFEGIPESSNETQTHCREKIYAILKNELGIHDAERRIVIERCHRDKRYPNHKPASILVRFLSFCDREEIWNKRDMINRNNKNRLYLNQDFPPEVEKKRAFLRPYVKAAYANHHKATLVGDQIMVDGQKYSVNELENLPSDIHPDKIAIQENEDTVLFYRSDAYLSNFYNSPLCIDGITYQNVEQYFTAEKARTFNDHSTVSRIMESENPSEMKFLGKNTQGFSQSVWDARASTVMINGLRAKFQQNIRLQTKLLNTTDKILAESSKNDTVWGTGLPMTDPNAFNRSSWRGKNQLGNLLMKVREEFYRRLQ